MAGPGAVDVRSVCRTCIAGCGIVASVDAGRLVSVRGDVDHPVSKGYLCPKGHALPWTQNRVDRLDYPAIGGRRVSWTEMLDDLAEKLSGLVATAGGNSIGRYIGTGTATDVLGKIGIDGLMAALGSDRFFSAVTIDITPAYRAAQLVAGSHRLQPQWVPEDEDSRLVLWLGSNPAVSHAYTSYLSDPVRRIKSFRERGGLIWVVDPRRTKTAAVSDHHLQIRPGTDYVLLAWLVREVIASGQVSEAFMAGTSESDRGRLDTALAKYSLEETTRVTGIDEPALTLLRSELLSRGRASIVSGTGINFQPQALVTEWLRWVLLVATDSLDTPGGMWFNPGWFDPLDLMADPLPPYREERERAASRPDIPRTMGELPVAVIPDEVASGGLRALIVHGGNPVASFPDPDTTRAVLGRLDLLVVADVVPSATTVIATHVLPVTGQMERIDVMPARTAYAVVSPQVIPPGGERRPMWWVCAQIAKRLGKDLFAGLDPDELDESVILRRHLETGRQDLGDLLEAEPYGIPLPQVRGYVRDRVVPGGQWAVAPAALLEAFEALDPVPAADGTFTFVNVRQLTRNCSAAYVPRDKSRDRPTATLHPLDAEAVGVAPGDEVRLIGADGEVTMAVACDPGVARGVVAATQGWDSHNVAALCSWDRLVDPMTGQPAMTALDVRIEPLA